MKSRILTVACVALIAMGSVSCESQQEKENIGRMAGIGAAGGAVLGLGMGALAGDGGYALAGAAVGAAAGAAGGAMYEYNQTRDDRRTNVLAESIGGANKGETVDAAGKRHLDDFIGEWDIDIWALDGEGKKITGGAEAKGVLESQERMRMEYTNIRADGFDTGTMSGSSVMGYTPSAGFTLENQFSVVPNVRKYVGEYRPDRNAYNFYPVDKEQETGATGIVRSNLRIEIRSSGTNLFIAETYVNLDGKETKVQEYRFIKR
jgi:hypothetical protein